MEIINNNSDMELSDDFFMENVNALKKVSRDEEIKKIKREINLIHYHVRKKERLAKILIIRFISLGICIHEKK